MTKPNFMQRVNPDIDVREIAVIGGGSSGYMAALALAERATRSASSISVRLYSDAPNDGEGPTSGVSRLCPSLPRNSPAEEFLQFFLESELVKRYAPVDLEEIAERAEQDASLGILSEAVDVIHGALLQLDRSREIEHSTASRRPFFADAFTFEHVPFSRVERIVEFASAGQPAFRIDAQFQHPYQGFDRQLVDAVICAQGAQPKGLPAFTDAFYQDRQIPYWDAMNAKEGVFPANVHVWGGAQSSAWITAQALNQGSQVTVFHKGSLWAPYHESVAPDGKIIAQFRFSGLRDPVKTELRNALSRFPNRLTTIPTHSYQESALDCILEAAGGQDGNEAYGVSALGFEPRPITFATREFPEFRLTGPVFQYVIGESIPFMGFEMEDGSIAYHSGVFGLGLAYPFRATAARFSDDATKITIDKPSASIVATNVTWSTAKALADYLIRV